MAVEFKMKNHSGNDVLFAKLPLGGQAMYKKALAAGVEFQLAFYSVTAVMTALGVPNKSVTLPASTTSLMKGSASETATEASIAQLMVLLVDVCAQVSEPVKTKVEAPEEGKDMEAAAQAVIKAAKVANGGEATEFSFTPTKTVVRLREAKAIGQPVRGSSGGSVYYAVALSPRVKLAARVMPSGKVSIRAEGQPSDFEAKCMEAAGLSKAGPEHWSIHFDASNVPPARTLGAFIMGIGFDFTVQITKASQLKVEV